MGHILALLLTLGAMQAPAAPPAPSAPAADPEVAALVSQLASGDAGIAARAESALVRLGTRATPTLTLLLTGGQRNPRAAAAVLRVIARVKDPEAMRALWGEWEHEETRDALIDAWAAFGDASVSPLAGYFATATTSQQEKIIEALERIGQPAVPALKGLRNLMAGDQSSLADRLGSRIDLAILRSPAVSLARKGRVAWRDLEEMAGNPATPEPVAEEAIRGLASIMSDGDEAAGALQRLAARPLAPALRVILAPLADDARLILLARQGEAAIPEYAAMARDPSGRESLRMGVVNALFGLGPAALPALEKLSADLPEGSLAGYVKELTATLRTMPAAPRSPGPKPSVKPGQPAGSPCVGNAQFTSLARITTGDLPISPRWIQRSPDGGRLLLTGLEHGLYRLVTMKADGSDSVTLSPLAHQFAPSWSSDGKRIVFLGSKAPIANPVDYNEVYFARADGGDLTKITTAPGAYASPTWLSKRDELLYAANIFASPQTGGARETSSVLFRHDVGSGQARALLALTSRIITAIEPSPDGRQVALLAWRTDDPGAGALSLHVSDLDGAAPRELGLVSAELVAAGSGSFGPKEALALGGDVTWSSRGRLTAAGRVIDLASWKIEGRIDPDDDAYATRTGSRTLFAPDGVCAWFDDTRQIMKRCPPEKAARPEADCRGALLWLDAGRGQVGLFDAVTGSLGLVQLPRPSPPPP